MWSPPKQNVIYFVTRTTFWVTDRESLVTIRLQNATEQSECLLFIYRVASHSCWVSSTSHILEKELEVDQRRAALKSFFFFILNILISIWNLLISYCVVPSSVHLKQAWQKSVWLISVQCHEFRCVPDMFRPIWEATGTPWLSQTARSAWCHDWHRC